MGESFIIAIDLGTAFSGYAFSISTSTDRDIHVQRWGFEQGQDTPKAPTCILFDQRGTFQSFGYRARSDYIGMEEAEAKTCYYFENFKMALYGQRCVKESLTIAAVNGKTMKALTVFTAALSFLKDDALESISRNTNNLKFLPSDFTWVLTVPAIWDDSAKQFMREAATQAGIVSRDCEDKLVIALEPEAASIWCKNLPPDGFQTDNHSRPSLQQTPGTQYIVVDCGGGTIDITVHEVLKNGKLKELQKASGNDMGGETVDKKFREFLSEVFSEGVWEKYERDFPIEVQRLMYDFTILKRVDQAANIFCSYNLGEAASKQKKDINMFFVNVKGASWNGGKIQISQIRMRSFFEKSLRGITHSLREILRKQLKIKYILLVGGYALSQVVRDHVKKEFGHKYKVLCPHLPQEVVMKGAIMFGRDPAAIQSRKSPFTYGHDFALKFDASKHKAEKKVSTHRGDLCNGLFRKMIGTNEDVGWDEVREYTFNPLDKDQKMMRFKFIRTEREDVTYIDDEGAEQVGEFVVNMPDTTGGLERTVKMEVRFGYTEITATANDSSSNSKASVTFNFI